MLFPKLTFFINEALTSLRRSLLTTFITVTTIALALTLMGAFLFTTMNLEAFLNQMQAEAIITAYISKDISYGEVERFRYKLDKLPEVSKAETITPEEAAKELFSDPDDKRLLQIGLSPAENPLPITVRIYLKDPARIKQFVSQIKKEPIIDSLSYGEELFEKFSGMSKLLWYVSIFIVILLGLSSMFIVYNTVRLTFFMRREEIIIMKLVGATDWFVRGPFIVEGFIEGFLGSIIATVLLLSGYKIVMAKLSQLIPFFSTGLTIEQLFKLTAKLFMMGLILGVVGSLLSLRDIKQFSKAINQGA